MYKKIESLYALMNAHLNIHEFKVPKDYIEFKDVVHSFNNYCTVRCDHATLTKDLPFYVVDREDEALLKEIWDIAQSKEYKVIVANGLKHDKSQKYNLVVKFTREGDFIMEVSKKKVPLRHMYRYPSELLSASGNIDESVGEWKVYNQLYGLDRRVLLDELRELYSIGIVNKWIECTFYPYPVGIYNKHYVFWQI